MAGAPGQTVRRSSARKHDPFTGKKLSKAQKKAQKRARREAKLAGEALPDVDLSGLVPPVPVGPGQHYMPIEGS